VGASILAALVFNEMPTALELVGGLIILVGIGIATWKKA
jgi:drug/metabolite transporter (DMT)-like permease